MKKLIATVCAFALSLGLFGSTASAESNIWGEIPTTAAYTNLWIAYPTDYMGNINVYIHSTKNPGGVSIDSFDFSELGTYTSNDWKYTCYEVRDLEADTYWMSLESDFDDFGGQIFPDTNFRTLLPNINKKYTKLDIIADNNGQPGGRRYNIQQFFGLYSRTEDLDANIDNLENLFLLLIQENVQYEATNYGIDNLVKNSLPVPIPGHYDDYVTLFQPYGCNLYTYFKAVDSTSPMSDLLPGFDGLNATIFDKLTDRDENEMFRMCSMNVLYQSSLFGWDLVFDTRNLEYDDVFCTTQFRIEPDGTLTNVFIRNLTDDIPKMKNVGTHVNVNDKEDLIRFLKESSYEGDGETYIIKDIDAVEEIDWGEEAFNTVPDFEDTPDPSTPAPQKPTEEPTKDFNVVPVVVACGILLLGIILLVIKKKKK